MLMNLILLEKNKVILPIFNIDDSYLVFHVNFPFLPCCKYSVEKLAEQLWGSRQEVRGS